MPVLNSDYEALNSLEHSASPCASLADATIGPSSHLRGPIFLLLLFYSACSVHRVLLVPDFQLWRDDYTDRERKRARERELSRHK